MITEAMLQTLRTEYAKINTIDPCGEAYPKLIKLLSALSQDDLKVLAKANIKFVSALARNRIDHGSDKYQPGDEFKING